MDKESTELVAVQRARAESEAKTIAATRNPEDLRREKGIDESKGKRLTDQAQVVVVVKGQNNSEHGDEEMR